MNYNIVKANIINLAADAIVLPANPNLKMGRGSSEAIFKAAGKDILEKECEEVIKRMGVLEVGSAVPTSAYNLNAQFIVHTVVPKWKDGNSNEYELLSTAYLAALNIADLLNCESIAFPLLASGNNGFDLEIALEIAKNSIESFEGKNLKQVILVIYGSHIASIVKKNGDQYIEFINVKEKEKKGDKWKGKKQIAILLLDNALKAFEFLKDEENYDTLVKIGKQIAGAVKAAKKSEKKDS